MSSTPPTPAAASWTVTGQPQATVQQDPSGRAVRGYTVNFTLSTGQAGQVFIPETAFTADGAKPMIAAAAANLAAIINLSSS